MTFNSLFDSKVNASIHQIKRYFKFVQKENTKTAIIPIGGHENHFGNIIIFYWLVIDKSSGKLPIIFNGQV
jgi:hypothetical protein